MLGRTTPSTLEVVNSEIKSIMNNHTWKIVNLPPESKQLGYKWILKKGYKFMKLLINIKQNLLLNDSTI
jgi:hypothetical protein